MMRRYSRRRFLGTLLAGGVGLPVLVLSGCGGGSASSPATGPSAAGTTATATKPTSPSPSATQSASPTAMVMPASTAASPAGSATTPAATATTAATSASQTATATAVQVKIVEPSTNYQTWTYEPDTVTVAVGTSITWTNTGGASHTVTADDGKAFDSGAIAPDKQWTMVMRTAGTFPYHCSFHPWMKGTITVTK